MSQRAANVPTFFVLQVRSGGLDDTYAAASLEDVIRAAQIEQGSRFVVRTVTAVDAGAARLRYAEGQLHLVATLLLAPGEQPCAEFSKGLDQRLAARLFPHEPEARAVI